MKIGKKKTRGSRRDLCSVEEEEEEKMLASTQCTMRGKVCSKTPFRVRAARKAFEVSASPSSASSALLSTLRRSRLKQREPPIGRLSPPPLFLVSARSAKAPEVFEGQYGTWRVEESDKLEVFLYRLGLTGCAASFTLAASCLLLGFSDNDLLLNTLFASGSIGFGLSLVMIHIYIKPAKRFLQGLFLAGVAGSILVSSKADFTSIPKYLVEHPYSVWFVGPLFASITGVGFKEGVCYNKKSAFALSVLTPFLLLLHLSNLADLRFESGLLVAWMAIFCTFALGKYDQPIHEDLGDKSVFEFLALSEEKQQEFLRERERLEQDR